MFFSWIFFSRNALPLAFSVFFSLFSFLPIVAILGIKSFINEKYFLTDDVLPKIILSSEDVLQIILNDKEWLKIILGDEALLQIIMSEVVLLQIILNDEAKL